MFVFNRTSYLQMLCSQHRRAAGRASMHSITLPPKWPLHLEGFSLPTFLSWLGFGWQCCWDRYLESGTVGFFHIRSRGTGPCWGPLLPLVSPKPWGHFCISHLLASRPVQLGLLIQVPRQAGATCVFLSDLKCDSTNLISAKTAMWCTSKITHGTLA